MSVFQKYPIASSLGAAVLIGLVILLFVYFTNVACPKFGAKCEKHSPPYTSVQSAIADQFFCKGECIK